MKLNSGNKHGERKPILLLIFIFLCTSVGMWGQTTSSKKIIPWKTLMCSAIIGNKDSQYFVGKTYLEGSEVYFADSPGKLDTLIHVNKDQAVYWLRKAAEQGVANAENELGSCYSLGEGVGEDDGQALYWFRKAADQGHSLAQTNVGVYYKEGYGVEKDGNNALYWFEKAIKNNDKTLGDNITAIKEIINELKNAGYSSSRAKIE